MPAKRKKPLTLPEIRPNLGIEKEYRKALVLLLNDIAGEVNNTLIKDFNRQAKQEKTVMVMDGIADWLAHVIDYLATRWIKKLDVLAPSISAKFVNRTVKPALRICNLRNFS